MSLFQLPDGHHLYVALEGNRFSPPILLLHGLGANSDSWLLQVPALVRAGYQAISPDFRGFGRSSAEPIPGIQDLADDMVGLLNHLEVKSTHVVGISLGGTVALQLAVAYPERVQKLVLINTFARIWPLSLRLLAIFLYRYLVFRLFGLEAQARSVADNMFPNPDQAFLRAALLDQIKQSNPLVYRNLMQELLRFDIRDQLSSIHHPTLVLTGALDQTVSPKTQQFLVKNIPGAIQKIIPGAGHGVTGQMPDPVNEALLDFFGGLPTATGH